MRYYYFCPRWVPSEDPPPIENQFDRDGRALNWEPTRCSYTRNGAPFDPNHNWGWDTTNDVATQLRCAEHNCRPMVYVRSWTADRHYQDAMRTTYERHHIRSETLPWLVQRATRSRVYLPYSAIYTTRRRPAPTNSHSIWTN